MSDSPAPEEAPQFMYEVIVPESESVGRYGNGFTVWFNKTDFTIDFLVWLPSDPRTDENGNPYFYQPLQVVSRIKIPPAIVFRLAQELSTKLIEYEEAFDTKVEPLGDPLTPPPDDFLGEAT